MHTSTSHGRTPSLAAAYVRRILLYSFTPSSWALLPSVFGQSFDLLMSLQNIYEHEELVMHVIVNKVLKL